MSTTLIRTDSNNPDFRALVVLLDRDLAIRDGDDHAFYDQYNKLDQIAHVVVAYRDTKAASCGAFKQFDETTVEIKRMFTLLEFRGQGIAGEVLRELERWAAESGFAACILETGKKQPEAIRLYQKSGYALIPNFGQYANIETSVCMRKALSSGGAPAASGLSA